MAPRPRPGLFFPVSLVLREWEDWRADPASGRRLLATLPEECSLPPAACRGSCWGAIPLALPPFATTIYLSLEVKQPEPAARRDLWSQRGKVKKPVSGPGVWTVGQGRGAASLQRGWETQLKGHHPGKRAHTPGAPRTQKEGDCPLYRFGATVKGVGRECCPGIS